MAEAFDRLTTRLRLRQLRLLVAVGQFGTIQEAARALHLSQPAATKMIKDLEVDLGTPLFARGNRGVSPTQAGAALIRHARLMLTQLSNAVQEVEDLADGAAGRVVVGTLLAASAQLLPRAIDTVLRDRPGLVVKVVEGTNAVLMPALRRGEIDLVVGRLPTHRHRAEITQEPLMDEDILAVAGPGHPLAGRAQLRLEDLLPFGWILPPAETSLRRQLDQVFQDAGVMPDGQIEAVSYLTNRALLQARPLIGVMPAQVVAPDLQSGALQRLDWAVPVGRRPIGVSYLEEVRLAPAGRALLVALRASRPGPG